MCKNLKDVILNMKNKTETGIGFISSDNYVYFPYNEVYKHILKMSSFLLNAGIRKGDNVIFQVKETKEFIFAFWACILNDFIAIPIERVNNKANMNLLRNIYNEQNSYIIYDTFERYLEQFDNKICINEYEQYNMCKINQLVDVKQIAYIQYSSGSTGIPKGVVLTHENILCNVKAIINKVHISCEDTGLSWLPLSHDMGLIGFHIIPSMIYADHYLMATKLFMTNPKMWIKLIDKYQITLTGAPNFALEFISNYFEKSKECLKKYSLESLRIIFNGAESISTNTIIHFYKVFDDLKICKNVIYPVYGLTEATLAVTFPKEKSPLETVFIDINNIKIGEKVDLLEKDRYSEIVCVGSPLEGNEVTIRNDEYDVLEELTLGHICISGVSVAEKYIIGDTYIPTSDHSFFDTGDIGFFNKNNLYVIGRENEIIINGKNYYLIDAEAVIKNVFKDCNIYSESYLIPIYENRNIDLTLFIKGKYSLEIIHKVEYARNKVYSEVGIKIKNVLFIDDIPYTNTGKVKRLELRSNYANNSYSNKCIKLYTPHELEQLDDDKHIILDLFQQNFGFKPELDDLLINYELASIDFYVYLGQIEECFKINFDMDQIWDCNSVNEIYEKVLIIKQQVG